MADMVTNSHYKKIVIKIGTNVITKDDGLLNLEVMEHIVEQISTLKKTGVEIIVVSSGAVGAGRSIIKPKSAGNIVQKQLLAAVGQIPLMSTYSELFKKHSLICGQVLATKEDFRDRAHYLNMKNCFEALLHNEAVPIVNENDVIAVSELMFTDNDELAGFVASMMNVDAMIILSNVNGVYDRDPLEKDAKILNEIDVGMPDLEKFISPRKSPMGRGGMLTKCRIAIKLSELGITTNIANGTQNNVLLDIIDNKSVGTKFVGLESTSSSKRWVANSDEKGSIVVNNGAAGILTKKQKAISILPVGVIKVEGDFHKGDIIKVCSEDGHKIGIGMAQYDAATAKEYMGQKDKKPIIHYDYLFITSCII